MPLTRSVPSLVRCHTFLLADARPTTPVSSNPTALKPQNVSQQLEYAIASRGRRAAVAPRAVFKSPQELQAQLPLLASEGISRVNLTNKTSEDDLLGSCRALRDAMHDIDICVHYSVKYNYDRCPDAACQRFERFCAKAAGLLGLKGHVLLVSGGGKRKRMDSLGVLQRLARERSRAARPSDSGQQQEEEQQGQRRQEPMAVGLGKRTRGQQQRQQRDETADRLHQQAQPPANRRRRNSQGQISSPASLEAPTQPQQQQHPPQHDAKPSEHKQQPATAPPIYVAYNPYLPDPEERAHERRRLRDKLATGVVSGVYLQMGTDLGALREGLDFLREESERLPCPSPALLGSVLVPTPRLLAQMRFRPWNGVFLSQEYLAGLEGAALLTRHLLEAYAEAGVAPLVESAAKTEAEVARVREMLALAYGCAAA